MHLGSRNLVCFLVADVAFALPPPVWRRESAVKHRAASLRVAGPPARKFAPLCGRSRASAPLSSVQWPRRGGRARVGRGWWPPLRGCVPRAWLEHRAVRFSLQPPRTPTLRAPRPPRRGRPPGAHAQPLPAPGPPRLNFPPRRDARVSREEAGSRRVRPALDRCVGFLEPSPSWPCGLCRGRSRPGDPKEGGAEVVVWGALGAPDQMGSNDPAAPRTSLLSCLSRSLLLFGPS